MNTKFKKFLPLRKEVRVALVATLSATLFVGGIAAVAASSDIDEPNIIENDDNNNDDNNGNTDVVFNPLTETLKRPYTNEGVVVKRYFYDSSDEASIRENAIIPTIGKSNSYENSQGVDYVSENDFEVLSACSGVVIKKASDSTYGNTIIVQHDSGVLFTYASLGTTNVNKGDKVSQGTKLGTSGESIFTSGLGESLHFEVTKNSVNLNPEKAYSLVIAEL